MLAPEPSVSTFSQGTITGYTGNGGDVEIPSSIDGVPVAAKQVATVVVVPA